MLTEFDWMEATANSPIFLSLILCSVVTLGIAVERAFYFWKRNGNATQTADDVMSRIRDDKLKEASWACEKATHPVGYVALQLFHAASDAVSDIEERFHVALSQQKLLLERNLNVLGTMAAIAPLIGLLGTVWGIMRAFSDMARVGSAAPSVVAAGVAEALVTTAAGLIVAVPALMLYNYFARRTTVMLTEAENYARSIRVCLHESGEWGARRKGQPRNEHKREDSAVGTAKPAPVS